MYYLFIVTLKDCPFSNASIDLLNSLKIKYKNLIITQNDKDKYKTTEIQTFPQIYLKKKSTKDTLLLGGYSELKEFTDTFLNTKYNENNINSFLQKYKFWTKKSVLRLIEILN